MSKPLGISVIIPCYNEAENIGNVLEELIPFMKNTGIPYEILTINDGSSDSTEAVAGLIRGHHLINHPENRGYGASIKTGVRHAQLDWVLWYDADGQHKPEHLIDLLDIAADEHMVVGARTKDKSPLLRKPGKWLLNKIANYLVDTKIPDLNSGLRLVYRDDFKKFEHLYPDGFSISTTITLSFLKGKIPVRYVPIDIVRRAAGKSMVRPVEALRMFSLIFRIITLFSPLRVFMPLTILTFLLTLVSLFHDIYNSNLTDATVVLFLSTLMMFSFGVTLDHVAAIRRSMHNL